MNRLLQDLAEACKVHARKTALRSEDESLSYRGLWKRASALASWLRGKGHDCVALYRENSIEWVVIDLACLLAGVTLVPVPTFFSDAQIRYLLAQAGAELLLIDDRARAARLGLRTDESTPRLENTWALALDALKNKPGPDARPAKITFTSGTTAEPRGVCLPAEALGAVASSLRMALTAVPSRTHLCLLPLSTLLENVAGVYVPLLTGRKIILYKGAALGLAGSSGMNAAAWIARLEQIRPDSMILIPQMLHALVAARRRGLGKKLTPEFIAVGGGKVSVNLVAEARVLGLPVYEGYGLSECGSVVSLNTPGRDRPGSVGAPLPHAQVRIDNGRILINTGFGARYMDGAPVTRRESGWLDSGDLGYLDADGFLHVTGRAKNVLISSYGRNISPEWLESELLHAGFAQCTVFGDAQPFCTAVIVPHPSHADARGIRRLLARVNRDLPDYARIRGWVLAEEAFTPGNGLLTQNGRPRREAIAERYRNQLRAIYHSPQFPD